MGGDVCRGGGCIGTCLGGSISAPGVRWACAGHALGARRASFVDHSPPVPIFAPPSPNNLENLLPMCKNLAHRSKKPRREAVHSQKEVVDVDAMSSDACPVRMLSEGEYGVHASS